jgi:hypothetical protein
MPCETPGLFGEVCPGGTGCLILKAIRDKIADLDINKPGPYEDLVVSDYSHCPQKEINEALTELRKRLRNSQ